MHKSTIPLLIACLLITLSEELPQQLQDEIHKTVPELIEKYNYKPEIHNITTEDGYILTVHRIVAPKKPKGTVLLVHGFLGSSADFIVTGPNHALGYYLVNEGYDVWLGNLRGNFYSRNHTKLKVEQEEFWNFSWHEIGLYDVPATIDYILAKTGEKQLFYIGHSLGTQAFYVMASLKPEYNSKIRAQFSMGPIAYLKHLKSPIIRILATFYFIGEKLLRIQEFLPINGTLTNLFTKSLCEHHINICKDVIFLICGFDSDQMNTTLLPLILAHIPAGTGVKVLLHYGQQINSGKFRQYDYGFFKNMNVYKSAFPPEYNLNKVTAPVYLHHSQNDWIATPLDVDKLHSELNNVKGKFIVPFGKFNHMDFVFGMDAPDVLYKHIISLMIKH